MLQGYVDSLMIPLYLFIYWYGNPSFEYILPVGQGVYKDGRGKMFTSLECKLKIKNYKIHAKTNNYPAGEWITVDTLYLNWV